jgi:SecD/SecF fusion protein
MKTKFNSYIAIILLLIMTMSFTNKAHSNSSLLIQPTDKNISIAALSQSATIISNRLKDFSSEKFELTVIPEKKQIQVTFSANPDLKVVEKLLTKKGKIGFYTSCDRQSLSELLKNDNRLFSLLKSNETNHSDTGIGYCSISDSAKVNEYLNASVISGKYKFVWEQPSDSSVVRLYALRLEKNKGSLLDGSDIESMKSGQEKGMKLQYVEINFKKPAIALWATITKQNIGHQIAIVLDNTLLCAPTVNSSIQNGKSQITGNFTETEVKLIAALGNNGELPTAFEVLK